MRSPGSGVDANTLRAAGALLRDSVDFQLAGRSELQTTASARRLLTGTVTLEQFVEIMRDLGLADAGPGPSTAAGPPATDTTSPSADAEKKASDNELKAVVVEAESSGGNEDEGEDEWTDPWATEVLLLRGNDTISKVYEIQEGKTESKSELDGFLYLLIFCLFVVAQLFIYRVVGNYGVWQAILQVFLRLCASIMVLFIMIITVAALVKFCQERPSRYTTQMVSTRPANA
jgi:hypothetical protein